MGGLVGGIVFDLLGDWFGALGRVLVLVFNFEVVMGIFVLVL